MNSKKKENFLNPIEGKRGKRNSSSNEQAQQIEGSKKGGKKEFYC